MRKHRHREQRADLGVGKSLGGGIKGNHEPCHPQAQVPHQRRKEKGQPGHAQLWVTGLALLACGFAYPGALAACSASSGPYTAPLVELYTSAGCAACRAAERRLAAFASKPHIVYLVIPYELAPGARPRKFTLGQRLALTPAPRVLLQGKEFEDWGTAALDEAVERILSRPAQASLELRILGSTAEALRIRASAQLADGGELRRAVLYLAAFGQRPERRVLEWQGPARFAGTRLDLERALPLAPAAPEGKSGVAAVVQNRRTGEVLQALSLTTCP